MTFIEGEQALSVWMADNAYLTWVIRGSPWQLEDELIAALELPLNLQGNFHNAFYPRLTRARAACVAQPRNLSIAPNPHARAAC